MGLLAQTGRRSLPVVRMEWHRQVTSMGLLVGVPRTALIPAKVLPPKMVSLGHLAVYPVACIQTG